MGWCATNASSGFTESGMQCCMRDEGGPLGSGVQTRLSNHLELLPLRAVVVSVKEKAVVQT